MLRSSTSARAAAGTALLAVALTATAFTPPHAHSDEADARAPLPQGLPPAAHAPEPSLPQPVAWPFRERFPRTSGTGRLADGALYWSDFIYDDYGAVGLPAQQNPVSLRAPAGTYGYSDTVAANNGADIFRAAVGLHDELTYWRVDWNTLVDPCLPAAMFGFTRDDGTPVSWPAGAEVQAGDGDGFILMTCEGAWVIEGGERRSILELGGALHVDEHARSFVAVIPSTALSVEGTWTLRLVSGLANESRDGFRQLGLDEGALPGQPNVYNVAFRDYRLENPANNYWFEAAQADALTANDITAFAIDLNWGDLAATKTEPEPQPTGWINRWYVSSVDLGQGYIGGDSSPTLEHLFLGRVQPYAVYVPSGYTPDQPAPVTWIMHSGLSNHNQWTAARGADGGAPLIDQLCEGRQAICVSTLGRGPWGWFLNEAEVDFHEVFARVWEDYTLDPDRITITGLSLGGWGANKFAMQYPDVFTGAYVMAGPPKCGSIRIYSDIEVTGELTYEDEEGRCVANDSGRSSGDLLPLVANARWTPFYISNDPEDPLVPYGGSVEQAAWFRDAGYRYVFDTRTPRAHSGYGYETDFTRPVQYLDQQTKEPNPARITLAWYPNLVRDELGIGTHRAWWISEIGAHSDAPGDLARVDAHSLTLPEHSTHPVQFTSVEVGDLGPYLLEEQTWQRAEARPLEPLLNLDLANVATLDVDAQAAGLHDSDQTIVVSTDSPVLLTLTGLSHVVDAASGRQLGVTRTDGVEVTLAAGTHELRVGGPMPIGTTPPDGLPGSDPPDTATPPLPATGAHGAVAALTLLLTAALVSGRGGRPGTPLRQELG